MTTKLRGVWIFVAALAIAAVCVAGGLPLGSNGNSKNVVQGIGQTADISAVPVNEGAYAQGEMIVGLREGVSLDGLESSGLSVSEVLARVGESPTIVRAVAEDDLANALQRAASLPGVAYVQPNYRYSSSAATKAADVVVDPQAEKQYYLNDRTEGGANVVAAWSSVSPTGPKVDVAVLDTGLYSMGGQRYRDDNDEPYFENESWIPDASDLHQEFDAENTNVVAAFDFANQDEASATSRFIHMNNLNGDDNGHGTHVSAIIAANAVREGDFDGMPLGMAGVSPVARIVPIKVLDGNGDGDSATFVKAFDYLLRNSGKGKLIENLRIVNMSFAMDDFDYPYLEGEEDPKIEAIKDDSTSDSANEGDERALREMIGRAREAGIITVAAAGNSASAEATYPSDWPEVLSVEALKKDGGLAEFSNYNENKSMSAPGEGIYSAWATQADAYEAVDGSSQSTAIVSGVLSMMWSANPNMTVEEAQAALCDTASNASEAPHEPVNGVFNGSHGAIDAAAAVKRASESAKPSVSACVITREEVSTDGEPNIVVRYGDASLKRDVDYALTVLSDDEVSDDAPFSVLVEGRGGYTGWQLARFEPPAEEEADDDEAPQNLTAANGAAKPAKTSIKKLKAGKRSFTVKWKRAKSGVTGYQVRYSLKKSMAKSKKKTVKNAKKTKLKVKKLKAKKRYYVQVRTYRKSGGKTAYSSWSKKKSVRVK